MSRVTSFAVAAVVVVLGASASWAATSTQVRIKDVASIEGIRPNPLLGYGLVVGLNGTGDRRQTVFSTQTLANVLQRLGVQVPATAIRVNNVAAVFVTATLPPFASPGMQIDVTVSSMGDAKSLDGGLLLLTPLYAASGETYAAAQGPVAVGGYSAGVPGNSKTLNHPTVGRIPGGAVVEKGLAIDLRTMPTISFLLRDPDFSTSHDLAAAVNRELNRNVARAIDARRVEVTVANAGVADTTELLARIQELPIEVHSTAKVIVNERTGTVVLGRDVKLSPVSILHGSLEIEVSTQYQVSQPAALASGQTQVVPDTKVRTQDQATRRIELAEGATVEDLVRGLQAIGATARDVVAILQAIQAAGALNAELEVM
jgi:flagellar P-ring protein precursor FlgI